MKKIDHPPFRLDLLFDSNMNQAHLLSSDVVIHFLLRDMPLTQGILRRSGAFWPKPCLPPSSRSDLRLTCLRPHTSNCRNSTLFFPMASVLICAAIIDNSSGRYLSFYTVLNSKIVDESQEGISWATFASGFNYVLTVERYLGDVFDAALLALEHPHRP